MNSAINRPFTTFDQQELFPEPLGKAASILESIVTNHPFFDQREDPAKTLKKILTKTLIKININKMKNKTSFLGLILLVMSVFMFLASSCDKDDDGKNGNEGDNNSEITYHSFIDSRDGNVYKAVTIGEQVWMAENLKYLPFVVGPDEGSRTTSYYYVYDYDGTDVGAAKATENYATYGVLYNLTAALNVCPDGWHLPSGDEWTELSDYLRENAGGKLKATGTIEAGTGLWLHPNRGATNETGFSSLPGGFRTNNSVFYAIGGGGHWWSDQEFNTNIFRHHSIYFTQSEVYRHDFSPELGSSVRCVRD